MCIFNLPQCVFEIKIKGSWAKQSATHWTLLSLDVVSHVDEERLEGIGVHPTLVGSRHSIAVLHEPVHASAVLCVIGYMVKSAVRSILFWFQEGHNYRLKKMCEKHWSNYHWLWHPQLDRGLYSAGGKDARRGVALLTKRVWFLGHNKVV